jgi:PAS domain S-box-containing protein
MSSDEFRWQSLFQRAGEPLFLLNRQRRLLFVNAAWEALTGLAGDEARGRTCRRHRHAEPGSWEALANALYPPEEVLDGQPERARRLLPGAEAGRRWCDVDYFPLRDANGLLGILGKITVVPTERLGPPAPLPEKLVALREKRLRHYRLDLLSEELPVYQRIADQVRLASQTLVPVVLVGEPGTGKHWVARTIHGQSGLREQAFAAVDCAHLPAEVLAGLLFGEGGLMQRAAIGTLYLREPAQAPRDLQRRLCERLAQESATGQLRLIAGCRTVPADDVRAGRLLAELDCVLGTLLIAVPPLRDCRPALPRLVEMLLPRAGAERPAVGLTPAAWEILQAHDWPGNIRELYAVLRDAGARAAGRAIDTGDLPVYLRLPAELPQRAIPLDALLEQVERRLILLALRRSRGNRSKAADLLSIWRPRLLRRMEALGIADSEGSPG